MRYCTIEKRKETIPQRCGQEDVKQLRDERRQRGELIYKSPKCPQEQIKKVTRRVKVTCDEIM
jgi:hypothetical protein